MAPPQEPTVPILGSILTENKNGYFELSGGVLSVKGVTFLFDVPDNVSFNSFPSLCHSSSDAPVPLCRQVQSMSHKGGFLGFSKEKPSHRLTNSLGRFSNRNFLSIFRFKTWWSTMWVGSNGSELQMESQWVLLDVPEIKSHILIIPVIEGNFRSALHPGVDGHVMICAESGSTRGKASSFSAIAYVHISDNPCSLMKEAYSALRVHLNTCRLLEEKSVPPLVSKFGWCTWDGFYLTIEPLGVWHGVKEFVEGGILPRFLLIDDGWQSISRDGEEPLEDVNNLVLCGHQMTARLYRFEECEKFRNYKAGTILNKDALRYDPKRPKLLISKALDITL